MKSVICLKSGTLFRALELFIAISLSLILLASIAATFIKNQAALQHWLEEHQIIMGAIAILECCLLLLWMCLGGHMSTLWNWLPPLCLFPKVLWVKWLVIIGLIAGTLAGIFIHGSVSQNLLSR
jgi:hypothetical protein